MASNQEHEVELPSSNPALELTDGRLGNGAREATDRKDLLSGGRDELGGNRGRVDRHHIGGSLLELFQLGEERPKSSR